MKVKELIQKLSDLTDDQKELFVVYDDYDRGLSEVHNVIEIQRRRKEYRTVILLDS